MSAVSPRDLAIPTSILLSAALLTWVVHRDLTAMAASLRSAPPSALGATAPVWPPGPAPAAVAPPTPPATGLASLATASPEVRERDAEIRRREQTQNVLSAQRAQYARICLGPGQTAPPLRLVVEFDANGNETTRSAQFAVPGFVRDSSGPDAKVIDCVTHGNVPKLKVDAPGKPVSMLLSLNIP